METIHYKELLSAVAIAVTFAAYYPYLRSIFRNEVKPHVFSWIIWATTTCLVFFAQVASHGGVGAWPVGVSGCIALLVAVTAYRKRSDMRIGLTDWLFFFAALSALPFWYFSSDPLWAVIILTVVDVLGFGPTVRKSFHQPHSESALFFAMFSLRDICVLFALEHYSVATVLFPAAIGSSCLVLAAMILLRRGMVNPLVENPGQ